MLEQVFGPAGRDHPGPVGVVDQIDLGVRVPLPRVGHTGFQHRGEFDRTGPAGTGQPRQFVGCLVDPVGAPLDRRSGVGGCPSPTVGRRAVGRRLVRGVLRSTGLRADEFGVAADDVESVEYLVSEDAVQEGEPVVPLLEFPGAFAPARGLDAGDGTADSAREDEIEREGERHSVGEHHRDAGARERNHHRGPGGGGAEQTPPRDCRAVVPPPLADRDPDAEHRQREPDDQKREVAQEERRRRLGGR